MDRSLVIEAVPQTPSITKLESKTRPDQASESDEAGMAQDVEDWVDRWVSVATFGALTVAISLLILIGMSQRSALSSLGAQVIALGFLELIFGALGAYIVRPSAMLAVVAASVLSIADGAIIVGGITEVSWVAGAVSMAVGLGCVAVGTLKSVRTWFNLYRSDGNAA